MDEKRKYKEFSEKIYIPIYSQPWWLDAVCGEDNWDVWLYYEGNEVKAAFPFHFEERGSYLYITKALLTQNNGIIFKYNEGAKAIARQVFEERVINAACEFIAEFGADVFEQQFHYNFTNWLPFFWNHYTAITRYTYVLENLKDLEEVWTKLSSKCRKQIKKGFRNAEYKEGLDYKEFYKEHEKVFLKQGLLCPFSFREWETIYKTCQSHEAGKILYAETKDGAIASVLFLVWDEKSVYHLLGGNVPEYQHLDTYSALTWKGIELASKRGLKYDFEGSVIKRIAKAFREFGGEAKPYFRIRKIFNPDIIRLEMEEQIKKCNQR